MIVSSGSAATSRAWSSSPSRPGIRMSTSAMSKRRSAHRRSASFAFSAVATWCPSWRNQAPSESRTIVSSSTTSRRRAGRAASARDALMTCLPLRGAGRRGRWTREDGAGSRPRDELDAAAVAGHDAVDHGQAEAHALARLLGREEGLEDARLVRFGNAAAGVGDGESDALPLRTRAQHHAPARGCRLERVHGQGQDHLLDLGGVALDAIHARGRFDFQRHSRKLGVVAQEQTAALEERRHVRLGKAGGRRPAEEQQVAHDVSAAAGLAVHHLQDAVRLVVVGRAGARAPAQQPCVRPDPGERVVDLVGHDRGQLAERGHLLHEHHLPVRALDLPRLLFDPLLQRPVGLDELPAGPAQLVGHRVPGSGQVAHLVARGGEHGRVEIAGRDAGHRLAETPHRDEHQAPDERAHQEQHGRHRGQEGNGHVPLGDPQRLVHRRHRELHVEDAQHALGRRMGMAGSRALGLVVDGGDDAQDPLPVRSGKDADAVLPVQPDERLVAAVAGRALLRLHVHERSDLGRQRRGPDAPLLVEDADAGHSLLGADVLDDAVNVRRVVAHHGVAGGAADRLGDAVRGQAHQPLELAALEPQVPGVRGQQDHGRAQAESEAHAHGQAPAERSPGRVLCRGNALHVCPGAGVRGATSRGNTGRCFTARPKSGEAHRHQHQRRYHLGDRGHVVPTERSLEAREAHVEPVHHEAR